MAELATVALQAKKARPFFGRHPWVYQNAIEKIAGNPEPGAQIRVVSFEKEFIAYGLFNPDSTIRVRLYSWDKDRLIDADLIEERIARAVRLRHDVLGLGDPAGGCRLVFSEADGLSGLIVARYADILVVQFTSRALATYQQEIVGILERLLAPRGIMRRTERGIGELENLDLDDAPLAGDVPTAPVVIVEHGVRYLVDVRAGQKTGFFLDQRDNRAALCRYTGGRTVLDLFCYGGGFGIAAAKVGRAKSVVGVDVSGPALRLAQQNADLNDVAMELINDQVITAMQQLLREKRKFGVVVCDPPKFARTAGALEQATKGYEHLNRLALELLEPGGVLLTCSCSGHVSAEQFLKIVVASAQQLGRDLQILEQRGQAPDHPVSAFCLATSYLKCLVGRVAD